MFAPLLFSIASEYNDALLIIENNSLGIGVLTRLQDLAYKNLYYSVKSTHEYVDEVSAQALGGVAGFTMSMKTRPLVIAKFEEFVRNKLITINSVRLANEIKTFVWHNGRPQNQREADYKKALLTSISVSSTKLNTKIEGQHGYKGSQRTFKGTDGKTHDLNWIIKG
jgi:hypothetical protein